MAEQNFLHKAKNFVTIRVALLSQPLRPPILFFGGFRTFVLRVLRGIRLYAKNPFSKQTFAETFPRKKADKRVTACRSACSFYPAAAFSCDAFSCLFPCGFLPCLEEDDAARGFSSCSMYFSYCPKSSSGRKLNRSQISISIRWPIALYKRRNVRSSYSYTGHDGK